MDEQLRPDDLSAVREQMISLYDAPAYVRRARQVEGALDSLVARGRRQRDEWLVMVRTRLAVLHALAGGWDRLRPLLAGEDQLAALQQLHAELAPRLRGRVEPASSVRVLRLALRELRESIERFNRRWTAYLREVDLGPVNESREGYNRYYVLEKECAVRSPHAARQGFRPLPPLTRDDLTALLPPLPVPRLS